MLPGQKISIIDEMGVNYLTLISQINKKEVVLEIISQSEFNNELPITVTVALGLTKFSKMEEVIRRITELGASQFIGVEMERSNLRLNKLPPLKIDRWELIVKEAAEQSGRSQLMKISPFQSFPSFLEESSHYDVCMFAYEESGRQNNFSLKTLLKQSNYRSLLVLVGPEGGIAEKEAQLLLERGFQAVGLGPRILRCETAPLYLMSVISLMKEFIDEG